MTSLLRRTIGASLLNRTIYEEIEADRSANVQAAVVVLLSAIAGGIGARGLGAAPGSIPAYVCVAFVGWVVWAFLTYQIGARLLPGAKTKTDTGELLRTIGFATAPGILRAFGVIPILSAPVFAITAVWMLVSMIVAVRQSLDYTSTARAVVVCGIGWVLTLAMVVLLSMLATPALADERAMTSCRLTLVRDSGTTTANCVLVRRDGGPPATTLYFVTPAHLFKDARRQPLPAALSMKVDLDGIRIEVEPDDLSLPVGDAIDIAVFKATTPLRTPAAFPLTAITPIVGERFVIAGVDAAGMPVRSEQHVTRRATLVAVGDRELTHRACEGAPATLEGHAFGFVVKCERGAAPSVLPLSGVVQWIGRHVPGGLVLSTLTTAATFDLSQRDLPWLMLTAPCGQRQEGSVRVPFTLAHGESVLDASVTIVKRSSLRYADVAVGHIDDGAVTLQYLLQGQSPRGGEGVSDCMQGQALLTVKLDILSLQVP